MAEKKIVCITGMERSGTSMLARIVNILGVYLGPQDKLILETDYNEKGCWEYRSFLEISDEILKRFGGFTHQPPAFPIGWENDSKLADLEEKAKELIEKEFASKNVWGWKDTRSCLTLPFWNKLLPDMDHVICVRNPSDVAKSLVARKWVDSTTQALFVWLTYTASVLKHTESKRRIIVFYEDFMSSNWNEEATRLAKFLGDSYVSTLKKSEHDIDGFITRGLQHYQTSLSTTMSNPEIPFVVKTFYFMLKQFAKGENESFLNYQGLKSTALLNALAQQCCDTEEAKVFQLSKTLDATKTYAAELVEINLQLEKQLKDKDLEINAKEQTIQALCSSYSWKLTAPLRSVFKHLK